MEQKTTAHIAVFLTNFFFAANYSVVKYIAPSVIQPFGLNVIRVGVSVILFWALWTMGSRKAGIRREHLGRFLLCALTGVAMNQMMFLKGITLTSAIHGSLLILSTPLIITVFAFWVLRERVTPAKLLGLALGIGGATFLVTLRNPTGPQESTLLGDLLIIGNAICYAIYFILVKPLMHAYHPLHVIRWIFTLGMVMILPFGWEEFHAIAWSSLTFPHYAALFSVVICGTFLAYYFNIYGIRHLGAGVAGAYIYTQPVLASIIAMVFLGESLSWQKILAGILIFAGVFLVSYRKPERAEQVTMQAEY